MRSNLIDLDMQLHHETDKAVLVSLDGDREKAVWLPKSAVEVVPRDYPKKIGGKGIVEVTLPESLALDKGLI